MKPSHRTTISAFGIKRSGACVVFDQPQRVAKACGFDLSKRLAIHVGCGWSRRHSRAPGKQIMALAQHLLKPSALELKSGMNSLHGKRSQTAAIRVGGSWTEQSKF